MYKRRFSEAKNNDSKNVEAAMFKWFSQNRGEANQNIFIHVINVLGYVLKMKIKNSMFSENEMNKIMSELEMTMDEDGVVDFILIKQILKKYRII